MKPAILFLTGLVIGPTFNNLYALGDSSGYLKITGATATSYARSSEKRIVWDGYKRHFQAGMYLPANTSVGYDSFAFGYYPSASASHSFAFGRYVIADAPYAFAFGYGDEDETRASGDYSLAFGFSAYTSPNADYGLSFGEFTTVFGKGSMAVGGYASASGEDSLALGNDTYASSLGSTAIGRGSKAYASYAFAGGYHSYARGTGSVAMGYYNEADGYGAVAMGKLSLIDLSASGDQSRPAFAFGEGLTVKDDYAFVIGRNNLRSSVATDDYLFVIGKGASTSSRSDAFSVDESGNVWAAGTITASGDSSFSGDVKFNNNALVSAASSSSNIDHIWHDDGGAGGAGGTWHFVSDGANKAAGKSRLQAAHIWMTGSGQNNYIAGNLGVGTSPTQKLDVNGSALIRGVLTTNGSMVVGGSDLTLGTNDGRPQGEKALQRALVHVGADELHVNYNGDFEGGVVLTGKVRLAEPQGGISMGNFQ